MYDGCYIDFFCLTNIFAYLTNCPLKPCCISIYFFSSPWRPGLSTKGEKKNFFIRSFTVKEPTTIITDVRHVYSLYTNYTQTQSICGIPDVNTSFILFIVSQVHIKHTVCSRKHWRARREARTSHESMLTAVVRTAFAPPLPELITCKPNLTGKCEFMRNSSQRGIPAARVCNYNQTTRRAG